ncbi:MAG: hypothetical protein P1V20_00755 [Verrucomicrobiales bacterium]|nr:hypothetical protein [Verrucomicrobiales bacterium]
MMRRLLYFFCIFASICEAEDIPFSIPDGFTVFHFAGDDLAHDIWCMTIDEKDRICVGGPGYIKFLIDTDGDGHADEAKLFTDKVRTGPMGLLVEGNSILSVESDAVVRYEDEDGDMQADGEPEILVEFTGRGGEHGPHGIRKGPDGWYYVVCGNNTGVDESHANLPGTPVKSPSQGCIIRIAPDRSGSEIVAHGFRNPYDIAFGNDGRLFTYDSDNERDHHLPWYTPTRVFDVAFGRHHGWLNPGHKQSYNTPEYYTIDRLAETGRGSPTGVEYYWHEAFPEKYRNGLFHACWTFGRIYHTPLQWESEDGVLLQERNLKKQIPETFAASGPEGGFAPVDLAVDSSGLLWVACGGRNTSGNVYCISPPDGPGEKKARKLWMPQMMVGRNVLKPQLQHPQTVRTFLADPQDLHLVYQAFQDSHGGINHRPEPRTIDAGYCFSFLSTKESQLLRDTISAEAGPGFLLEMDLKAEDALTKDAEEFAAFWLQPEKFLTIEPWRDRNYKELARTLGCVKTEFAPVLEHLTTSLREDTHPTNDVHYLFCLAQIPAPRTSIGMWRIASAFLQVDAKLAAIPGSHPSRNWPLRLQDLFTVHCELAPKLGEEVMWSHSLFGSSIHHARYIETLEDPVLRREVTEKMYRRIRDSKEEWTISWAKLLKENMPGLAVSDLRAVWDSQPGIREFLGPWFLPKADLFDDTGRLYEALSLQDSKVVKLAAEKLAVREPDLSREQKEIVLSALIRHQKRDAGGALLKLLRAEDVVSALANAKEQFPDSSLIVTLAGPMDFFGFEKRLAKIDWQSGNANAGGQVFTRLGCAACHSGQNRLGPDMKGVAARFGRDDFFRHTMNPNLAISDLYKAVEISTRDGRKYTGVAVYSSPDQTILEVGPGQTVNFSEGDILESKPVKISPMPAGLLLGAGDHDLADLWAYVKSLQ